MDDKILQLSHHSPPSSSSTAAWDSAISTFFSGSASRLSTSVPDTALPLLFTPAVTVREPSVPTAVNRQEWKPRCNHRRQ